MPNSNTLPNGFPFRCSLQFLPNSIKRFKIKNATIKRSDKSINGAIHSRATLENRKLSPKNVYPIIAAIIALTFIEFVTIVLNISLADFITNHT